MSMVARAADFFVPLGGDKRNPCSHFFTFGCGQG